MNPKDELDPNVEPENMNEKNIEDKNKDGKKGQENINNLSIRAYLDKTVVPLDLKGMVKYTRKLDV